MRILIRVNRLLTGSFVASTGHSRRSSLALELTPTRLAMVAYDALNRRKPPGSTRGPACRSGVETRPRTTARERGGVSPGAYSAAGAGALKLQPPASLLPAAHINPRAPPTGSLRLWHPEHSRCLSSAAWLRCTCSRACSPPPTVLLPGRHFFTSGPPLPSSDAIDRPVCACLACVRPASAIKPRLLPGRHAAPLLFSSLFAFALDGHHIPR